jgi:hypothetical protein
MALGLALERRGDLTRALWPFLKWCADVMDRHLKEGAPRGDMIAPAFRQVLRGRKWRVFLRMMRRESSIFQRFVGNASGHGPREPGAYTVFGVTSHRVKRPSTINITIDPRTLLTPTFLSTVFIHELAHATHRVMFHAYAAKYPDPRGVPQYRDDVEEEYAEGAENEFKVALLREGARRAGGVPRPDVRFDPVVMLYQAFCDTLAKSKLARDTVRAVCEQQGVPYPCSPERLAEVFEERAKLYGGSR